MDAGFHREYAIRMKGAGKRVIPVSHARGAQLLLAGPDGPHMELVTRTITVTEWARYDDPSS